MQTITSTQHLCYNCFRERDDLEGPCPYCGFDLEDNAQKYPIALPAGTVLNGRYIIGRVLGQGGFGITYLALDTQLQAKVAIKEFMPSEIATRTDVTTVSVMMADKTDEFTYGSERFLEEARTLAKFIGNPNIAGVSSYFDENDTSYFVMDYIEGVSFKSYIASMGGKVSIDDALNVMIPVLRALTAVHAEGFIHRDVTPDNIYISKDGNVKLLDFGSARYSIGDKSKSLDVVLKVGYAPKEQYIRRGRQGPYTDVYSCAASLYAAITGYLPPESLERMDQDTLVPISELGIEIPAYLDNAILKGLAVQPEDRFQSAAEFLDAIESQTVVEVPASPTFQSAPVPEKKKPKALVIGGIAAALAVAVGLGVMMSGGNGGTVTTQQPDGTVVEKNVDLIKAEVPAITIQGEKYSTDLTSLDLMNVPLTDEDVAQLKYMVNLRKLYLPALCPTENLDALSGLSQLKTLSFMDDTNTPVGSVDDLSFLNGMNGLTSLRMMVGDVKDLSPLAGMTDLTELRLRGPMTVNDLSPLSGLTKLQSLRLEGGNLGLYMEDLSPLAGMTELVELRLDVDNIDDFTWLENMTELRSLECYGRDAVYDNVDFLKNLTKLQTLRLPMHGSDYSNAVPIDISGLSGLTELVSLDMEHFIVDLEPLRNLTKLRSLEIQNGGMSKGQTFTSLEPLRDLPNLVNLSIRTRNITDWSPVDHVPNVNKS